MAGHQIGHSSRRSHLFVGSFKIETDDKSFPVGAVVPSGDPK